MTELLYDPNAWIAFGTLTVMEIVLGIDNIVFISVIVVALPPKQAKRARQIGLALALVFRIAAADVSVLDDRASRRRCSRSFGQPASPGATSS